MNKKVQRMLEEIERRGGVVHLSGSLPDDLAEEFLEQVLACPACCSTEEGTFDSGAASIDIVLAGTIPRRFSGH